MKGTCKEVELKSGRQLHFAPQVPQEKRGRRCDKVTITPQGKKSIDDYHSVISPYNTLHPQNLTSRRSNEVIKRTRQFDKVLSVGAYVRSAFFFIREIVPVIFFFMRK